MATGSYDYTPAVGSQAYLENLAFGNENEEEQQLTPGFEMQVDSRCCASVRYNPVTAELTIQFQERGTFLYKHFSLDDFAQFEDSSSRGGHFNNYIRGQFDYERIS